MYNSRQEMIEDLRERWGTCQQCDYYDPDRGCTYGMGKPVKPDDIVCLFFTVGGVHQWTRK